MSEADQAKPERGSGCAHSLEDGEKGPTLLAAHNQPKSLEAGPLTTAGGAVTGDVETAEKDGRMSPYFEDAMPSPSASLSKTRRILLAGLMTLTYFLASGSANGMIIMIPRIAADLEVPELKAQWVVLAHSLAAGCGLLVSGHLADIYGRKHLYLLGMTSYGLTSLACTFVHNEIGLCVLRALSGLGQATAMPATFGIVGYTFQVEPERTIAFAVMGLGWPVGGMIGQVIAGVIAGAAADTWRYFFLFLACMALLAAFAGYFVIPSVKREANPNHAIDWAGAVLITSALALFSFTLTQGGLVSRGWRNPYIPGVFALSLFLFGAFIWWQRRLSVSFSIPPLIHPDLFKRHAHKVTYILLITVISYTATSGWVYITTIWYQNWKGESPLLGVLHVLTAPIVGAIVCLIVPFAAPRVRAPFLLAFGGFMTAAACWLYAVEPVGTSYWACEFLANICNPFGPDFIVGIGSVLISNLGNKDEQSLLGALFQTALMLSGTIGTCLCSLVQTVIYNHTGDLLTALRGCFWMIAGLAWLAALMSLVLLRKVRLAKDVAIVRG